MLYSLIQSTSNKDIYYASTEISGSQKLLDMLDYLAKNSVVCVNARATNLFVESKDFSDVVPMDENICAFLEDQKKKLNVYAFASLLRVSLMSFQIKASDIFDLDKDFDREGIIQALSAQKIRRFPLSKIKKLDDDELLELAEIYLYPHAGGLEADDEDAEDPDYKFNSPYLDVWQEAVSASIQECHYNPGIFRLGGNEISPLATGCLVACIAEPSFVTNDASGAYDRFIQNRALWAEWIRQTFGEEWGLVADYFNSLKLKEENTQDGPDSEYVELWTKAIEASISGKTEMVSESSTHELAPYLVDADIQDEDASDAYAEYVEKNISNWANWIRQTFGEKWGMVADYVAENGY